MAELKVEQQGTDDSASPSATGYVTRPGVVTFICITNFIFLAFQIFYSGLYAVARYQPDNAEYLITIAFYAIGLGIPLTIVLGLWYAKNWARIAYIIVFPLYFILEFLWLLELPGPMFIFSIVRLLFVAYFCVLLYRPKSSGYFRGEVLPPVDPGTGLETVTQEIVRCPSCNKEIYSTAPRCHHCGMDLKGKISHGATGSTT